MSKLYVKYILLFTFIFGGKAIELQAQSVDLVLDVADRLFERQDYYGAVEVYKKAISIDSNNAEVLYKYGKSLTLVNNNKLASRYLKKALALDQRDEFIELPFELAEAYRSSGNYKQAKRYYNRALRPYRTDREGYWYKKITISKEANDWAYKKSSSGFEKLNNLGNSVNSNFAEFGATISDGKLYYSAMIADSVGLGNVINDAHFYSRIYQKALNDEKSGKELEFDKKSYSIIENKHISNPCLFDGKIYFSVCDTNYRCEIWRGDLNNMKVSNIKQLNKNINTSNSNNTQAHVIKEENEVVMYFASDRNQGFGGLDIWKSKLESFGFGKPVNLGNVINTPDNEITPFYDTKSRTLFFSSNWHIGFGGYDVFQSKLERKVFQPVENLGAKVNSNYNEYYFQPYKNLAILSSNRVDENIENGSSCCNDLFETGFFREEAQPEVEITEVDEETLNKMLPLSLYFHNDSPDPNSKDTITTSNYTDLAKKYIDLKASYLQSYLPSLPKSEQGNAEIALNDFFDIDVQDGLTELEKITPLLLEELKKGHYLTLSIRGFASSISNSDYNLNLTLRRIQSLINYFKAQSFSSYIESGHLKFNKIPFGEFAVSSKIDENDKIASVYSPAAVNERKIEILAIQSSNPNTAVNLEKLPLLKINPKEYSAIAKKGDVVKRGFLLENNGKGELKIYQVIPNHEGVSLTYPKTIPPNGKERIIVEVNTEGLDRSTTVELLVVSNDSKRNLEPIKIDIRLTN